MLIGMDDGLPLKLGLECCSPQQYLNCIIILSSYNVSLRPTNVNLWCQKEKLGFQLSHGIHLHRYQKYKIPEL